MAALALGAYELGAGLMETAPLWGSYAAGAAQMGGGYAMQGLAGIAGALGTAGAAVGGYNALSNAFGKKPHNQTVAQQGMCSCKQTQPAMSCEQKCQYGRYMNQKCKGCNGGKKTYKRKYRASYSSNGRYSLNYGAGPINLGYNGTTKKKTGTRKPRAYAARKTMRQTARQTRKTTRTNARVARRANRRWRN